MKIAVVDDSMEDAQCIVSYLEQFQTEHKQIYHTNVLYASFDFLEEYKGEYDVIFLDIEMPGSNGLDMAREIREKDQSVGIIFITSLAQYAVDRYEVQLKNYDGKSLAVMSSFNFIGDRATGANPNLLNHVLRDEWGFRGMVLSDWNGSYGYQITDDFVRNGNDAMLGFGTQKSNEITNTSPTLVLAMRQAAKNILYTVANSGNYTIPDPNAGKMPNMTKLFIGIDAAVGIVSLGIMALVLVRYFNKRKKVTIEVVPKAEE